MRPRGGVRRLPVAAARAVWSGLLVAAFAAPTGMLASLPIHCSCRNRRSRWSYRLSEPAMEVLKRPEAALYSYSPWFCRAEVPWCWWPQGLRRGGKQGSRRQCWNKAQESRQVLAEEHLSSGYSTL